MLSVILGITVLCAVLFLNQFPPCSSWGFFFSSLHSFCLNKISKNYILEILFTFSFIVTAKYLYEIFIWHVFSSNNSLSNWHKVLKVFTYSHIVIFSTTHQFSSYKQKLIFIFGKKYMKKRLVKRLLQQIIYLKSKKKTNIFVLNFKLTKYFQFVLYSFMKIFKIKPNF